MSRDISAVDRRARSDRPRAAPCGGCSPPAAGCRDRPGEIPELRALVEVRNAGGADLDGELRQRVVDPVARDAPLERQEVLPERGVVGRQRRLRRMPSIACSCRSLGFSQLVNDLGLAHRLEHVRDDPLAILAPRPCRPSARAATCRPASGTAGTPRCGSDRTRRRWSRAPRRLMRAQRAVACFHAPGSSDRTFSRARTSSLRLVSCVDVAESACGHRAARARSHVCRRSGATPKRSGSPPTSFSDTRRL